MTGEAGGQGEPAGAGAERRGVVVAAAGGELFFIDASVATKIVLLGPVTPVPGLPEEAEGVGLAEGRVVTVVSPFRGGPRPRQAVLCELAGDQIALRCEVAATGRFPMEAGGVVYDGRHAAGLDVRALYAKLEAALWAEQARQRARRSVDSARARSSQSPGPSSGRPRP